MYALTRTYTVTNPVDEGFLRSDNAIGLERRRAEGHAYLWDTFPEQVIFVRRRDITFE